ncbi:MAG: hypothetical protein JST54_00475 [Deltaproteobacteria bacterium]|nr:hypothetical protein [Deltaproteobacteria bacterium]
MQVEAVEADAYVEHKRPSDGVRVRIANNSNAQVQFHPELVKMVQLVPAPDGGVVPTAPPDAGAPVVDGGLALASGVDGGLPYVPAGRTDTPDLGTAAVLVAIPLVAYVVIDEAVEASRERLLPGDAQTFSVVIPEAQLDSGHHYQLLFDEALGQKTGALPPLELVEPASPHFGYAAPTFKNWYLSVHLGGGIARAPDGTSGLGGVELGFGHQFGRLGLGGHVGLGIGSEGFDLRVSFRPAWWLTVVPSAGYEIYPIFGSYPFGHGPRAMVEANLPVAFVDRFGWRTPELSGGLYLQAGPVFTTTRDTVTEIQAGLSISME